MTLLTAISRRRTKSRYGTKSQGISDLPELRPEGMAPAGGKIIKYQPAIRLILLSMLITIISSFQRISFLQKTKIHSTTPPNLILHFKATVHGQPLLLHQDYTNPFGETFRPDIFRFYAGKISPALNDRAAMKEFADGAYHLIDFSATASTTVSLRVPEGVYNEIHFLLGVDSIDQTSGAQTGALDPARGMFWTWNTGYLSFKIEGTSPDSKEPAHGFSYHIGGYRSPNSTVWRMKIATRSDQQFRVERSGTTNLVIPIELDYFFDGLTPIHIRNTAACTSPGDTARLISGNFTGAFTGIEIPGPL